MERLAASIVLLWGWRRWTVAALAGAFLVLAQAPFGFTAAAFVSFPVLVWLLDGAAGDPDRSLPRRVAPAAAVGWWFGFGYFVAGLWWIGNALLVEADRFAWALPLAVIALPAVLALFWAFAAALARLLWSNGYGRVFAVAAGFGAAEWLREFVGTGFPWNAIGYAATPSPVLMQSASVLGVTGLTPLAVLVFATPAVIAARKGFILPVAFAVLLAGAHAGFGVWRLGAAGMQPVATLDVRLVQPAVDQGEKWDASARERVFGTLIDLSTAPPRDGAPVPQVIVWPETAFPFVLTETPEAVGRLADALGDGQVLVAGAVRVEGGGDDQRYYNSIYAIDSNGQITGATDKRHLVPFGEYLPFSRLLSPFGLEAVAARVAPFSASAQRNLLSLPNGVLALPLICYEALFPAEMDAAGGTPTLIVNLTNDAWYGATPGPYQHFQQSRLRAVEQGLPMIRVGNNGISAVIDPWGRIAGAMDLGERGAIDRTVQAGRIETFYSQKGFVYAGLTLALLFLVAGVNYVRFRRAKIDTRPIGES